MFCEPDVAAEIRAICLVQNRAETERAMEGVDCAAARRFVNTAGVGLEVFSSAPLYQVRLQQSALRRLQPALTI